MRTDEIRRNFVPLAKVNKLFYPLALCRGRTTDAKRCIYFLNSLGSVAIELEVIALGYPSKMLLDLVHSKLRKTTLRTSATP